MRLFRSVAFAALSAVIVLLVGLAAVLPFAGSFLVVEDPLERADAIYVLGGGLAERTLEGADLYREGYAPLVVLSEGYLDAATQELDRRGVHLPGEAEMARDILIRLGVPSSAIYVIPVRHTSTRHEAVSMESLARRSGWKRVIVVSSKIHTRRARFVMREYLRALDTAVIMRASRYDLSEPARWWERRADVRAVLVEFQFFIAYALGLA